MDVEKRVVDGLMAAARIRQNERQARRPQAVPIVAYTAGASASDEARWLLCGVSAVVDKPSNVLEMGACLERWCPSKFAAI
jgi:CheY-like chemotaxis protein